MHEHISLTHVCAGSYVHVLGKCLVTMSCSASVESHFNDSFVATTVSLSRHILPA